MAPRHVDKEKRKTDIALAAMDLFAEEGFEKTTISSIAQRMGIGKGTVYEYFSSKEELIIEVILTVYKNYENTVKQAVQDYEEPENKIHVFLNSSVFNFINDQKTIKLFFMLAPCFVQNQRFKFSQSLAYDMQLRTKNMLVEIINNGVESGVFSSEAGKNADIVANDILAFIDGISMQSYYSKNYINIRRQLDFHVENILAYLKK